MKAPDAHRKRSAGLARSLRSAIVVPSLLALALFVIRQPEMAGFAILGTFAHLVLVNYDTARNVRFAQSAMLTALGAVMVGLGALASASAWLAVGGAVVAGFLSELGPLASGRVAPVRRALLLSFMCAVAAPAPSVFPYLAGWLLAGVIAQPALLLIWIPPQNSGAAGDGASSRDNAAAPAEGSNWAGNAARSGLAMGLAILLARLLKVEHAFWVVLGVIPVLSAGAGSATRKFWQELKGTLIGFSVSVFVVAIVGPHQVGYWLILPPVIFGSAYAATAVGFVAGQAAFTIFAVVLFCILLPQQKQAGILRLEDIAIGGAVSLVVGSLLRFGEGRSSSPLDQVPQGNRVKKLCGDETCEKVVIPSGDFAAEAERIFAGGSADQVESHVLDGGEVGRSVIGADTAFIVAEHHVHDPMEAVLDHPVDANSRSTTRCSADDRFGS